MNSLLNNKNILLAIKKNLIYSIKSFWAKKNKIKLFVKIIKFKNSIAIYSLINKLMINKVSVTKFLKEN